MAPGWHVSWLETPPHGRRPAPPPPLARRPGTMPSLVAGLRGSLLARAPEKILLVFDSFLIKVLSSASSVLPCPRSPGACPETAPVTTTPGHLLPSLGPFPSLSWSGAQSPPRIDQQLEKGGVSWKAWPVRSPNQARPLARYLHGFKMPPPHSSLLLLANSLGHK